MRFPESAVLRDPGVGVLQRLGGEAAAVHAAVDLALEQAGGFEHAEMLGDRGERHRKGLGQFRDHGFAAGQTCQDGTARGIGQGAKGGIERRD